MKTLY